ncbi:crossover junction endodeoxyribonuclease RuvC [soil metagenome]
MRILGIDPGIGRMGWGVIDVVSQKPQVVGYGCLETEVNSEVSGRLKLVYEFTTELFERYQPDALATEELFFSNNAKTAFSVGQARGVVLLAAAQAGVPITIYTPMHVKLAVSGYGKADKNQVGQMVKTILKLESIPKPDDTADALAIALTHAFSHKMKKL